jgi:hypothetical protein
VSLAIQILCVPLLALVAVLLFLLVVFASRIDDRLAELRDAFYLLTGAGDEAARIEAERASARAQEFRP